MTPTPRLEDRRSKCSVGAPSRCGESAPGLGETRSGRLQSGGIQSGETQNRALYKRRPAMYKRRPAMVFKLDRDGKVLSLNDSAASELGYTRCELAARSVLQVIYPKDRPSAKQHLRWALDSGSEAVCWELRKIRKDGTMLWVRETALAVNSANDAPQLLVVCEDVSEHRRVEMQLAEVQHRLYELNAELADVEERQEQRIARVLHDGLGQELATARLAVCRLRDSEAHEARAGCLEELRAGLDRSIEVTRSLTFQLSPPMLYDLGLAAALQALGERIEDDHGIPFVSVLREGWSAPEEGTGVVLYRAVRELFYNVTKHAQARRISLELDGADDRIWIVLEDDGLGFDSVDRGAAGRASTGMGLFQVGERLQRLGGSFELDSAPGRGTRARLTLHRRAVAEVRESDRKRSQ